MSRLLYLSQILRVMILLMFLPLVSYAAALEGLETIRLFRLQNPHVNVQKGEQLEAPLYREKRDIEGLQGMAQGQTTITQFLGPRSGIS